MILRPHQVVDQLAPHWGIAVSAAVAAASIAAQQAQAAKQRRDQQNAAQASKQGLAVSGSTNPSVASSALGQLQSPDMQKQIGDFFKPRVATDAATAMPGTAVGASQPGQTPMPSIPQGQNFQQALGGQDQLQQLLQQLLLGGGMGG